jgi:hypothetical protein
MDQIHFDGETGRTPAGRTRFTGRVGRAMPGAIAGVFLVAAIALGASSVHRPASTDTSSSQADGAGAQAGAGALTGSAGTDNQGGTDGRPSNGLGDGAGNPSEPTTEPTGDPAEPTGDPAEPTTEPTTEPTSEPTAKPSRESMNLVLTVTDGGAVKVDWTRCEADGAVAYKVVRSTDGHVTWPYGGADRQLALIMDLGTTVFVDTSAPTDRTLVYRVFCVGGQDGAWTFLDSTPGRVVHVPGNEPTPTPEPTAKPETLTLSLSSSETGGVYVGWGQCGSDGFSGYKVVRSPDEATSWPLGGNDTLVTYLTDRSLTHFVDTSVEAGGHYFYRVFCVHATGDGFQVLNSTHVEDFTVPAA